VRGEWTSTGDWSLLTSRLLDNSARSYRRNLFLIRLCVSFYPSGEVKSLYIVKEAKKKRRRPEGGLGRLSAKLAQARSKRKNPLILSRGNENRESEKTREEDVLLCSLSERESHWKRAPRRKCVWHKKMGDPSSSSYCLDGFKNLVLRLTSRIAATLNKEIQTSSIFNFKNRCLWYKIETLSRKLNFIIRFVPLWKKIWLLNPLRT